MIQAQKGTKDILPEEISNWQKMEKAAQKVFSKANFKEIRTPIFEATELFARGVGDSTDIVNKEMYTFEKSERSLTLRPENTAGVVRAYIEHGFSRLPQPVKLWYKGPMFRYERPQAGRQRQFHQVGVEMFGCAEASADAEVINLAVKYLNELGLNDLDIEINSLGCPECRNKYREAIKNVLKPYLKDRIKIYTSDYLHENWGTNRNFLERGWAPESFIIGARNHDSGKMEYSEEQARVLGKILKINTPKTQKEFVKAKLAEPMDAKYSMIYFADALNIDKPFQGNSDRTLDYATLIPEDYQNRYFASLERGEGYNPMDALEKQFKAKGLDRTEPKLYRKIVKYKKILEQKEKQTNPILKAVCGIICACLLLYGAAKYHKNRSHDLFH